MPRDGDARRRSFALLQQAASAHQRGDATEARRLAKQILRKAPDHFDALHLLGIIEAQRGHHDKAAEWIGKALVVNATSAEAHANLGNVAREARRLDEALASFDASLAIRPDYANAWNGRGLTLFALERLDEALACFERALEREPSSATIHYNRGTVLIAMQRLEAALAALTQAVECDPGFAPAHSERGKVLLALKREAEALAASDRAVQIAPDVAAFYYDRGLMLASLGQHESALASFDRAIAIDRQFAAALVNRGGVLERLGRLDEALSSFDQALTLAPDDPAVLLNRGTVLGQLGRFDEALTCYERATALHPTADAFFSVGALLDYLKRHGEAAQAFRAALAADPGRKYAPGRLVHNRMHACDWDGLGADIDRMLAGPRAGGCTVEPYVLLFAGSSADDQLQCAKIYVADRYPAAEPPLASVMLPRLTTAGSVGRERTRIAYVCGEFREHATAYLAAELFELHDRTRFDVFGVSTGPSGNSPLRRRLEAAFDTFIDGQDLSDRELAERLHAADIDIGINLNGHVGFERTGVFALRPCPIQVSYLGFPATMGADYIDYVIADRQVIPPHHRARFTEKVVYLPHSYQPNDSQRRIGEAPLTRAAAGLPLSRMVFCCFNNTLKITPEIFTIWMRLLRQVDGVLWLLAANADAVRNLRAEAIRHGVPAERLVFAPRLPLADHLARHRLADLFLDTLPCNAHTTASDALWAGLPVLNCRGETFAGRVGASLLSAVGLPELITTSLADYEEMALRLAGDPALLADFKARLAQRERTPLFDSPQLCRDMETAYVTMWKRWQRGEPPASFTVGDDQGSSD
jgi:protein O-GlcNAc transferase